MGVTPLYGLYITSMCGPKVYGFSTVLVIKKVSILANLAILVINRVCFFADIVRVFVQFPSIIGL